MFTPPERSVVAEMGPRGGAGPAPPLNGDSVDFVLTLGGDGLLMYSNTLFRVSFFFYFSCFFFSAFFRYFVIFFVCSTNSQAS